MLPLCLETDSEEHWTHIRRKKSVTCIRVIGNHDLSMSILDKIFLCMLSYAQDECCLSPCHCVLEASLQEDPLVTQVLRNNFVNALSFWP